jgi:rubredoxin
MPSYECKACGYIYNPDEGDPFSGIEPCTRFEDLPDDWVCPDCGLSKDDFYQLQ